MARRIALQQVSRQSGRRHPGKEIFSAKKERVSCFARKAHPDWPGEEGGYCFINNI